MTGEPPRGASVRRGSALAAALKAALKACKFFWRIKHRLIDQFLLSLIEKKMKLGWDVSLAA